MGECVGHIDWDVLRKEKNRKGFRMVIDVSDSIPEIVEEVRKTMDDFVVLWEKLYSSKIIYSIKITEEEMEESDYIKNAKKFLEEAEKEFERGIKEGKPILIRDSAEKAWGATIEATNELFRKKGVPRVTSHAERRRYLNQLEKSDSKIEEKGFSDRFMARDHVLHENCFYEGYCNKDELKTNFEKIRKYIKDVEEAE